MKRFITLSLSLGLMGAACTSTPPSDWQIIAQQDITGDTVIETVSIKPSTITLDSSLTDGYQYTFTELTTTAADSRTLLHIDQAGITSEDSSTVKPVISTQAAYALGLGKPLNDLSRTTSLFYVVQIDAHGQAVSEPITFSWDQAGSKWAMGK